MDFSADSLKQPVSAFMSTNLVVIGPDSNVRDAAKMMKRNGSTEVLVVKDGKPLGILTERDVLYSVVAEGKDPAASALSDFMTKPLQTIDENASAGDAIAMMSRLGIRRLCVTRKGALVGMVSQKSVVSGKPEQSVPLPELNSPKGVSCPYCGQFLADPKELSRHIDTVHIGKGLLQGNVRQW
jgi:CBS domain-containing protein